MSFPSHATTLAFATAKVMAEGEKFIQRVLPCLEDERTGCVVCAHVLGNDFNYRNLAVLGNLPTGKRAIYWNMALSKTWDLAESPPHIVSSFQIRDEANETWAGGIRVQDGVLAIAGFKEFDDEAFALLIAFRCKLLNLAEVQDIATKSGTMPRFGNMRAAVKIV